MCFKKKILEPMRNVTIKPLLYSIYLLIGVYKALCTMATRCSYCG